MVAVTNHEIWVITYNYGSVKAGPVIRFLRYHQWFLEEGFELVFHTKLRAGESPHMLTANGIRSVHIDCDSHMELTKVVLQKVQKSSVKPKALIFFSVRYQNYFDFYRFKKLGLTVIYVSTMRLQLNSEFQNPYGCLRKVVLLYVLRRLYNLISVIVSSTKELQKDFIKLSIPLEKQKIICNGIDTTRFTPVNSTEKGDLKAELGFSKETFLFLYVGLFVERKGVIDLIKTFQNLYKISEKQFKLVMVGHEMRMDENSEEFESTWPKLKEEAFAEGWLVIHPFSKNIHKYYQASDCFVFMSKLEGMPNVLLEAMSCGLPVCTSIFQGFGSEYGMNGVHYRAFIREVFKDTDLLKEILYNDEVRSSLSNSARSWSIEKFEIKKSISEYVSLFTAV